MKQRGPALLDPAADLAIDRDVGAAEAIDRLLGIADDEETAGLRLRLPPVGLARIVGGEQQQDLGLQRIGVLELVDEDALEAALEALAHAPVVAHQVACDEQQIEKIERAVLRLHLAIALQRARELLLQERREVGVGGHAELVEPAAQVGDGAQHLVARHALTERRAAPMLDVREHAIARQVDEPGFPAVVVGRAGVAECLLQQISSLSRRIGSVPVKSGSFRDEGLRVSSATSWRSATRSSTSRSRSKGFLVHGAVKSRHCARSHAALRRRSTGPSSPPNADRRSARRTPSGGSARFSCNQRPKASSKRRAEAGSVSTSKSGSTPASTGRSRKRSAQKA